MTEKRRRYSADFKFRVALEAAKGQKTLNELASEHGVHPNQISTWKHQLLEGGPGLFGQNGAHEQREQVVLQTELFEQIGRLKMELEWVKKSYSQQLTPSARLLSRITRCSVCAGNASYWGSTAAVCPTSRPASRRSTWN
jgi:transposase-like protein